MPVIPKELKESPSFYEGKEKVQEAYDLIKTSEVGSYFFADMTDLLTIADVNYRESSFGMYTYNGKKKFEKGTLGLALILSKDSINFNNYPLEHGLENTIAHTIAASFFKLATGDFTNIFSIKNYGAYHLSPQRCLLFFPIKYLNSSLILPPQGLTYTDTILSVGEYLQYISECEQVKLTPIIEGVNNSAKIIKIPLAISSLDFFYNDYNRVKRAFDLIKTSNVGTYLLGDYWQLESAMSGTEDHKEKLHQVEYPELGIVYLIDNETLRSKFYTERSLIRMTNALTFEDFFRKDSYCIQLEDNKYLVLASIEYSLLSSADNTDSKVFNLPGNEFNELCSFSEYLTKLAEAVNLDFSPLSLTHFNNTKIPSLKYQVFNTIFKHKIPYQMGTQQTTPSQKIPQQTITEELITELNGSALNPDYTITRTKP